jgi:AAA15 family ATPase/GTPase
MLSYFRIRNYRSILDIKVDFSYAEKRASNKYKELSKLPFLEINKENRFIPSLAIYGANASGKTNIVRAFMVYKTLIDKSKINGLYFPNRLNPKYNTAIFEIEFFISKGKYKHFIEYDNNKIIKEFLYKNNKVIYEIDNITHQNKFENISTSEYGKNKITSILNVECSEKTEKTGYIQNKVFLSVIEKQYSGLNTEITTVKRAISNIFVSGSNNFVSYALKKYNEEKDNTFLEKVTQFIKKFDIDIAKIQPNVKKFPALDILPEAVIRKLDGLDETEQKKLKYNAQEHVVYNESIDVYHKDINNNDVVFDFSEESLGTKLLLGLMYIVVKALDAGGTLIIDEIDRSIHSLVFEKIIELFKDKDFNKNNAQLIFTTHCTDILEKDILRISEVATVTKTLKNGSTISRISDFKYTEEFKNIRNTTDFRKLYLQGVFGGVPFPYI